MTTAREAAVLLVAQALEVAPGSVNEQTTLGMTPQWDSLAHMRLILALEERLGRRLEPTAIISLHGLVDVVALLESDT